MKLKRCIIDTPPKRIIALSLIVTGAISAYHMWDFFIFTVFVFTGFIFGFVIGMVFLAWWLEIWGT